MLLLNKTKPLISLTVEKTKKHRRYQNPKIMAALIADIAVAFMSGGRRTIRHIAWPLVFCLRHLSNTARLTGEKGEQILLKYFYCKITLF
jgi:hypothetical protein